MSSLLEARHIRKIYSGSGGLFTSASEMVAVDDFSLVINDDRPSFITIAGESGSGKTTIARMMQGIISPSSGEVLYKGTKIESLSSVEVKSFRRDVQAIFQDPFEVYNPFYKVDHILTTPITKFGLAESADHARSQIETALEIVGLNSDETLGRYPHQLSGGQRQRITIARALLLKPKLIVADEPVSMVDASLRASILSNMYKLYSEFNISFIYITHDLTTAYQVSEDIIVLYRGKVAESGPVEEVIKSPKHPYTQQLISSIPLPKPGTEWLEEEVEEGTDDFEIESEQSESSESQTLKRRTNWNYIVKRVSLFLVVIIAAASLNFFIPRLGTGRDPIREKLGQLAASGGLRQDGIEAMVKAYQEKFGLDQPLYMQYLNFLGDTFTFDLGYSLANYPARVGQMIGNAIPWTIGLMLVSVLIGFALGTLIGALSAWPNAPPFVRKLAIPLMAQSAIPPYLLGLIVLYVLGLKLELFPLSGGYSPGMLATPSIEFYLDVLHHSVLPALAIVLQAVGFWALGMRGMMITASGEDFVTLAEANGLRNKTIFFRFGLRNALLPQFTALGLSLANVVAGQVIVEVIFAYPGIGTVLFQAIQASDYTVINGVVLFLILSIGLVTMLMDFLYPLLDPRISHQRDE